MLNRLLVATALIFTVIHASASFLTVEAPAGFAEYDAKMGAVIAVYSSEKKRFKSGEINKDQLDASMDEFVRRAKQIVQPILKNKEADEALRSYVDRTLQYYLIAATESWTEAVLRFTSDVVNTALKNEDGIANLKKRINLYPEDTQHLLKLGVRAALLGKVQGLQVQVYKTQAESGSLSSLLKTQLSEHEDAHQFLEKFSASYPDIHNLIFLLRTDKIDTARVENLVRLIDKAVSGLPAEDVRVKKMKTNFDKEYSLQDGGVYLLGLDIDGLWGSFTRLNAIVTKELLPLFIEYRREAALKKQELHNRLLNADDKFHEASAEMINFAERVRGLDPVFDDMLEKMWARKK